MLVAVVSPHAHRRLLPVAGSLLIALSGCHGAASPDSSPGTHLDAAQFVSIEFGGEGKVSFAGDSITLGAGSPLTGARWNGTPLPTVDYELSFVGTRVQGGDFFCGVTFPVRDSHCTLILGGWGGALVGLSCLDGLDASENDSTTHFGFVTGQRYHVRLRVTARRIAVLIDDETKIDVNIEGRAVSLRADVALTPPLSVCSYATTARISDLRLTRR